MSEDGQDPRRGAPRQSTETINCHLGEVIDISSTGVRIRCSGKPPFTPGSVSMITFTYNGGKLKVGVQERWRKRVGWRNTYEAGLMFVKNSPSVIKAIESLVKFGFLCPDAVEDENPRPQSNAKPKTKVKVSLSLPDHYAILGLTPDAKGEQIHAAYRTMARRFHPDTSDAPDAEARFIDVCQAYKVLSDPQQRKTYDLRRAG